MSGALTALRARLHGLLRLDDPPPRIALALAVGVFIGCTPFWGFQTLLSILAALVFRLNRAATITGTWLNVPWVAPLVYGLAFKIGTLVVPDPDGVRGAWLQFFLDHPDAFGWSDYVTLFEQISVAILVGTAVVGAAAAIAAYVVALVLLTGRRRRPRPPALDARDRPHAA